MKKGQIMEKKSNRIFHKLYGLDMEFIIWLVGTFYLFKSSSLIHISFNVVSWFVTFGKKTFFKGNQLQRGMLKLQSFPWVSDSS